MPRDIGDEIRRKLFQLRDVPYQSFTQKLIPTIEPDTIIGVRAPEILKLAKQLVRRPDDADAYLQSLPHAYFDENMLHAAAVSEIKDFEKSLAEVERFLPYVDNWAVCDRIAPKAFKQRRGDLIAPIRRWLDSEATYTLRFAVKSLMDLFLDDAFRPEYLDLVAAVRSDNYYVNMGVAWYFAAALAKQYDAALKIIQARRLDPWTHNKAIQKAIESYRVAPEQKEFLRALKVKTPRRS